MEKIIEFNNVSFKYAKETIFSNISFDIYEGDFLAIIGSNGTGKSTLLRLMLGEVEALSGNIKIFGDDIKRFKKWPRVGYVPQNAFANIINFPATAYEIVAANLFSEIGFLRFPKLSHSKKVMEALKLLNMEKYASSLIGELSGGQMQRVFLSRALAASPDILILDEPTNGVDNNTVEYIYKILSDLNIEKKLTVVMVTHDIANVSKYSSRTLCMEHGSIMELDKKQIEQELCHKHKHPENIC